MCRDAARLLVVFYATVLAFAQVFADVMSGLRAWCYEVGLGVGRLDQMLLDDAVGTSIAPDALLQVSAGNLSRCCIMLGFYDTSVSSSCCDNDVMAVRSTCALRTEQTRASESTQIGNCDARMFDCSTRRRSRNAYLA